MNRLRIPGKDKIDLIGNLSTMLSAGIPMYEAIEALLEDSKGGQKKVLEQLREDLSSGYHIYDNFAKFPLIFNKIDVNLIKAAEEAGKLEITLKDLRDNIQRELEFSDKIKAALTYPVLVIIVFFLVLLMMLIVVMPKVSSVFSRLKVDLPLPTKILIFVSNSLLVYWPFFLIGSLFFILIFVFLYQQKREKFFSILFSLPLVSGLIQQIDLTRFSRSMFLLLSSGITFTQALELAQDVVMTKKLNVAISQAREDAIGGKKFSEGLKEQKKLFPSMAIKLIEVGEKTGKLDESMQNISEKMDYEVNKNLASLTALLEPVMLVFVGLVVGGMMMAIIAPIYGLISQVGAR